MPILIAHTYTHKLVLLLIRIAYTQLIRMLTLIAHTAAYTHRSYVCSHAGIELERRQNIERNKEALRALGLA